MRRHVPALRRSSIKPEPVGRLNLSWSSLPLFLAALEPPRSSPTEAWLKRTNLWRERTNPRTGPKRPISEEPYRQRGGRQPIWRDPFAGSALPFVYRPFGGRVERKLNMSWLRYSDDVGLRNRSNAAATVRPVAPAGPPRYPSRHPSFWKHWGPVHLSAIHEAHPQPR
jgi:hypothetical protein